MKALVTGWRGFLGSYLVEKLKKEGHDVILFKGDVRNYADCLKESKGCDLISHLAAISSGEEKDILGTNVVGTLNFLKAGQENKIKKFHFVSSSEVYRDLENIGEKADEGYPIDFTNSAYATSKLIGETLCANYSKNFSVVINRVFNVYGPGQKEGSRGSMIIKFANAIKNSKPLTIWGDGRQTRDWTYVDDIVDGISLSITKDVSGIINLCSGKPLSTLEIVKILETTIGEKTKLEFSEYEEKRRFSCGDNTKAKGVGWTPKISFEEGVRNLLAKSE